MMPPAFAAVRNGQGERLDAAFHAAVPRAALEPADAPMCARSAGPSTAPTIALLAHGVTSNKDRPYLVELADSLAGAGIAALRFSFAGNGDSEGRFEDATPSKEVDDLGCVIDAAVAAGHQRIVCVGHSLGGAVGLLRAARDPRIGALVSLAGMVHVDLFMQRHFGGLSPGQPMLGRPGCPWSVALADDASRLGSLLPQASRIAIPWLLVHGSADDLVPIADSLEARAAAGGRPELRVFPGVDHRFAGAGAALSAAVTGWLVGRGFC